MSFRPQYKFLVGGIIIAVVIVFLLFTSLRRSTAYYLTVEGLMAQGPSERMVRVAGLAVPGTIDWDPQQMILQFEIADESGSLPVLYEGARPDMLQDDAQVVVEGRYRASGVFKATALLLKCPSKYVEE